MFFPSTYVYENKTNGAFYLSFQNHVAWVNVSGPRGGGGVGMPQYTIKTI